MGYLPGLDGLRGIAVSAVLVYHAGVSWLPGGFFTLDTFFVLSGFLITTLLLQEVRHTGGVRLAAFWARRARRLLPALLLMVAGCAVFVGFVAAPGTYPSFRSDAFGTLFYVANWHFIMAGTNYFVSTAAPSPLTHTWSLAVEEQFYVLWPLVILLLTRLRRGVGTLLVLSALGALSSSAWMALRFHQGASFTRLYYGTDTHAQSILVGAALAALLAHRADARRRTGTLPKGRALLGLGGDPGWLVATHSGRRAMSSLGIAATLGTALLWWQAGFNGGFPYEGGFLVAALLSAMMLASAVTHQRGPLARALSMRPLAFIGRISYGLYLWHYPLFEWIDPARTGLRGTALLGVRLAAAFVVATASFFLVERPIRHGSLLRGRRGLTVMLGAIAATAALVVGITSASAGVALPVPPSSGRLSSASIAGDPIRAYVTGDSMALTLSMVMNNTKMLDRSHLVVHAHGFLGCGVVDSDNDMVFNQVAPTASACQLHPTFGEVSDFDQVAQEEAAFHPDVVLVLAGRWESDDVEIDGSWTNIFAPSFQELVVKGLEREIAIARQNGARVLLVTSPCSDSGTQPDGSPWPQDSLQRLAIYNGIVERIARSEPSEVSVFDLDRLLCPGGKFSMSIDGDVVRTPDGIHLAVSGQPVIDPVLFPVVVRLGEEQRAAARKMR